jgi:hypothetical protein
MPARSFTSGWRRAIPFYIGLLAVLIGGALKTLSGNSTPPKEPSNYSSALR